MKRGTKFLSRREKHSDKNGNNNSNGNGNGIGNSLNGSKSLNGLNALNGLSKTSEAAAHKHRPLSAEAFFSFFKTDSAKRQASEEESKLDKETQKITEIKEKIADLGLSDLQEENIRYALRSQYASGDVAKAIEMLQLQQISFSGTILPYDPSVRMLGAENRGAVTCYLDSLLFAMFAKLESFECMLKGDSLDEAPKRLALFLRLWVNLLRSGKLIEADMTMHIQEALAACGWTEAKALEQQDTSEAFAFITETLQLPLLTLKVDLFHQGKGDDADHKVVYERLLNLGVPPETEGKGVKLEDCLEEYFNAKVDVLRDSLDEKKTSEQFNVVSSPLPIDTPTTPKVTTNFDQQPEQQEGVVSPESDDEGPELPQIERRWTTTPNLQAAVGQNGASQASGSKPAQRPNRSRTESIIQRVVLDEDGKPAESDAASLFQRTKKRASVVKAVTIPAWQFFKLIPWHSPANKEPQSNLEVARHFSRRPVVGICLKRYMMDEHGNAKRQNTFIDIPDSLRLPHFISDEQAEENVLSAEYKLVLQSVVCHRGDSLHSGHYISFGRVAPKLLTDNRRHDRDPPPDYEEAQWVKFDDLSIDQRVTPVDDIKQSLKEEMPYLLFYQIVPVIEVAASSADSTETKPPSYDDTTLNIALSEASGQTGRSQDRPSMSRQASSCFESLSALPSTNASVRFSADLEPPSRPSFADEDGYLSVSRRDSVTLNSISLNNTDSASRGQSRAPSPAMEETTAQRLSRAASKFRGGNKSRPQSQGEEGRISLTISRLGGLVRPSRDALRESTNSTNLTDATTAVEDDFEVIEATDSAEKEKDKDKETAVNSNGSGRGHSHSHHHKRGRAKTRSDKGKGKEKSKDKEKDGGSGGGGGGRGSSNGKGGKLELPDRECVVQ